MLGDRDKAEGNPGTLLGLGAGEVQFAAKEAEMKIEKAVAQIYCACFGISSRRKHFSSVLLEVRSGR